MDRNMIHENACTSTCFSEKVEIQYTVSLLFYNRKKKWNYAEQGQLQRS
jgi:hypothetical protein